MANAEFAIAWLMATFVFLPPYLLAIALFAHGANISTEEFRTSMERTLPASLLLSALLCVGAWVLGEPVLWIFGGDYAVGVVEDPRAAGARRALDGASRTTWWRCGARSGGSGWRPRLAGAALVIEVTGATVGAIVGGRGRPVRRAG